MQRYLQISLVTQKVITFNDTIAASIGYGKDDATDENIVEAAKRADAIAHHFHKYAVPIPEGEERDG